MASMIDPIDFSEYMERTEFKAKVRPASDFCDDMVALLCPHHEAPKDPEMFSTKLRGLLRFRKGEVTAWAGYNGHKKSLYVGQVALDMLVQQQRVLIMSMEMQPERTLLRMLHQASGLADPPQWWVRGFVGWTDNKLWLLDHHGRLSPAVAVAACRYFAEVHGGHHVIIDSMMMVCDSEEHLDQQKQLTTDLVRVAQETGLHIHLVVHCRKPQSGEDKPPGKYDIRGSSAISDQCSNVVTVWSDKREKKPDMDPDALVTVEKQRNGAWEGRIRLAFDPCSLRFTDDRQASMEPYAIERNFPRTAEAA